MRATTSLSRSTASAPVSSQVRRFSSVLAMIREVPSTGPSTAPTLAASPAIRVRNNSSLCQRSPAASTSVEMTTSPARNCGARPPAIPKLTRQFACRTARSTSAAVRWRSPPPTTVEKPAARAILASAKSPVVQSTCPGNVSMKNSPRIDRRESMFELADLASTTAERLASLPSGAFSNVFCCLKVQNCRRSKAEQHAPRIARRQPTVAGERP